MAAPVIPTYGGTIPLRTQSPAAFANNAADWLTYQSTIDGDYNSLATYLDALAVDVDADAVSAAASEANAAASAAIAAASSDYKGEWSSLSGALNKPASVSHNGAFWALVNNLADVTTSTPSAANADWKFTSGTRWVQYNASATLNANSQCYVLATGAATDLTQPTFAVNDFIVIKNSASTTQTVRLLNPSNTIIGDISTLSAGDNLVIPAGDVVHLVARASNILEIV